MSNDVETSAIAQCVRNRDEEAKGIAPHGLAAYAFLAGTCLQRQGQPDIALAMFAASHLKMNQVLRRWVD